MPSNMHARGGASTAHGPTRNTQHRKRTEKKTGDDVVTCASLVVRAVSARPILHSSLMFASVFSSEYQKGLYETLPCAMRFYCYCSTLLRIYIYIYIFFLRTIGKYSIDNGDFLVYFLISSSIYSVASTWDSIA